MGELYKGLSDMVVKRQGISQVFKQTGPAFIRTLCGKLVSRKGDAIAQEG